LSLFRTGVRIPDLKLSDDLLLANISLNTFVRAGQITSTPYFRCSAAISFD
jgi:hypothetical protein